MLPLGGPRGRVLQGENFVFQDINHYSQDTCTVRPPLSGHVGTGAHPDKGFVRIWETQCLLHVAANPMVAAAMLRLVVLSVQLDQNCRTYFISK